ncbi:MAG: hypothetical protein PHH77_13215, partial [Victivallaceae bacterium]|nr:hypothetical protein [Victivallaceae bacterium]
RPTVKRFLLFPFYLKSAWLGTFAKKAVLSLGCPICCPSVIYNLDLLGNFRFSPEYTVNLDWNAWLELSQRPAAFRFVPIPLMQHRVSDECETRKAIRENRRQDEDKMIFRRLWPEWFAAALAKTYEFCYIGVKGE